MSGSDASQPGWDVAPPEPGELLVVVGPTASGKTDLALSLAERFGAHIVGADSVQIYRAFDLGSGKPSDAARARVPHHLIDQLDPFDHVDAASFAALANAVIAELRSRAQPVIVCGGTYLWVKALLFGLAPGPPRDEAVRNAHNARALREGRASLHAELAQVDPESARRLAPNDLVRVSRALEVFALSGKTQSEWHAAHAFKTAQHRARLIGVARERPELDDRIRRRTREWLEAGFVAEVESLVLRGFGTARAMGSVGYAQVKNMLDGRLPPAELEDAIVRATRVLVRRQRTWLRDAPVEWLRPRVSA
ncbi:MAG: tRNA (adenosine(37)-N6)-dimethylallyltransferase MiaA [Myxococcales bacterium]|nr:tRNA (adenosine(37)-N6)-dimethylallyltransferase MiaA [Myxococcales bacterium]